MCSRFIFIVEGSDTRNQKCVTTLSGLKQLAQPGSLQSTVLFIVKSLGQSECEKQVSGGLKHFEHLPSATTVNFFHSESEVEQVRIFL